MNKIIILLFSVFLFVGCGRYIEEKDLNKNGSGNNPPTATTPTPAPIPGPTTSLPPININIDINNNANGGSVVDSGNSSNSNSATGGQGGSGGNSSSTSQGGSSSATGGSSSATGGSNSNTITSGNSSATGGNGTGGSSSAGNSTSNANNSGSSNSTNTSTNSGSASNQANNSTNNNSTNNNNSSSTNTNTNVVTNTLQASCNSAGCACSCPQTNSSTPCNSECGKPSDIQEVNTSTVQALMAGSLQVGTVTILKLNSSEVRLTFTITSDRHCLNTIYGYIGNDYPSNQSVSLHNLKKTSLGCKTTETLVGSVDTTKNVFVSALADVFTTTFSTISYVSYQATAGSLTSSYITVNITSSAGSATAPGYCFDKNTFITLGTTYQNCKLMSTLRSDLPVVNPENVELVNYIMNRDYTFLGGVTAQDKQDAIWKLLQDVNTTNVKALNIIADALQNGQGFTPAMNQKVGLLIWCGATIQPNTGFFTMSDLISGSVLAKMLGNTNFCQSGSYQAIKFL